MAKTFSDALKELEMTPYNELVELTQGALILVGEEIRKVIPDKNPSELILPMILVTLSIDGSFSDKECMFLGDVLNTQLDRNEYAELVRACNNGELVQALDEFVDVCSPEAKAAFVLLCACFASVDGISYKETAFLNKLFE